MRSFTPRAVVCFLLAAFAAADPAAAADAVTVIRAGRLIDGKSSAPRRDQVIVVRGNRIESVATPLRPGFPTAPR